MRRPRDGLSIQQHDSGLDQALRCSTRVNGETRQDSSTSDMIFGVREIIEWLSTEMTLLPGAVILTGTPSGVGVGFAPPKWLKEGDVVECEIERIGEIRNRMRVSS